MLSGLEFHVVNGITVLVYTDGNPAAEDLTFGNRQAGSDDLLGVGLIEFGGQLDIALLEGQANLAHRLGNIHVGGLEAQPLTGFVLLEEHGLIKFPDSFGTVGTGYDQIGLDPDGENILGVTGIVGDSVILEAVTGMVLHPQLSRLDDSGVGIGCGIEILGNCAPVMLLVDHPQAVDLGGLQSKLSF